MNVNNIKVLFAGFVFAAATILTGCGQKHIAKNITYPPYENLLNSDKLIPDANFDTKLASESVYSKVKVYTANGQAMTLDAISHPLLFTAYWCPHCQRTLEALQQNSHKLKELPYVVCMGFGPQATLQSAVKIEKQEIQDLGLKAMNFYYIVGDPEEADYIPNGYPTLIFSQGNKLLSLSGEHEFSIWQTALN